MTLPETVRVLFYATLLFVASFDTVHAADGGRIRVAVSLGDSATLSADEAMEIVVGDRNETARKVSLRLRGGEVFANDLRGKRVRVRTEAAFIDSGGTRLPGELTLTAGKELLAVIEMSLESYLVGVVSREMAPSWPTEALKAQAVLARTYAAHEMLQNAGKGYDLYADTRSQAFVWQTARDPAVTAAVAETEGWALEYNGSPIEAFFHACSGGQTATAEEVWGKKLPYVSSVADPEARSIPECDWKYTVSPRDLGRAAGTGTVDTVEVVRRSRSGRADLLEIRGRTTRRVDGEKLRALLGYAKLKSTLFEVSESGGVFVFSGRGSGHGVGMSQRTAKWLAERGIGWQEILDRYYPTADLVPLH